MSTAAKRYLYDAAERIVATFVVAFLTTWLVNPGYDLDAAQAAAGAGVVAAGTLLKVLVAKFVGSANTAAILPAAEDTPKPAAAPVDLGPLDEGYTSTPVVD